MKLKPKKQVNIIEFLDFFAGIGLFRLGFEKAGWKCRGHCEIDKYANQSYNAIHEIKDGEWFEKDITKVRAGALPTVPLWTGGFPCQDCSVASGSALRDPDFSYNFSLDFSKNH